MHFSFSFTHISLIIFLIHLTSAYKDLGCFPQAAFEGLTFKNSYVYQSSGYCEGQCEGNYIIALTIGDECYCAKNVDTTALVDSSFCSNPCSGYPQEMCGGSSYFNVIVDNSIIPDGTFQADLSRSSSDSISSSSTSTSTSTSSSSTSTSTSTSSSTSTSTSPTSTSTSASSILTTSTTSTKSLSSSSSSSLSFLLTTTNAPSSIQLSEVTRTTVLSSVVVETSIFNSQQSLVTIVQSVTAVSVETKTATAIMTATLAPTTTNVNITPQNKSSSSSISHGAIAGIVIGVVLGTILLASLILWFCGVNLFCIPGRNRGNDYDDDEKSIRDDSISIHNNSHLNNDPGLTGFGRTPAYLYNADELSIGFGTRRFSQGSLPDAAGGSESDSSNKRGLRVINPDLSDDEK